MTDPHAITPLPPLPPRDPRGHKGTFGIVAVVGGQAGPTSRMIGAPVLAARGALRAGAGLVRLALPEPILSAAMASLPSATGVPLPVGPAGELRHEAVPVFDRVVSECTVLAVGPGLGLDPQARALALRAVQQEDVPVVVDADALTALAGVPDLFRDFRARAVLTPHPGEFRRLATTLRIAADPADPHQRPRAAQELAQRLGCIVVLKGAGTVVSDGQRLWVCGVEHGALATGGTGDVLTGVVASIIAQHAPLPGSPLDLFSASCLAVEAHARAALRWANGDLARAGMLAHELADNLPDALASLR